MPSKVVPHFRTVVSELTIENCAHENRALQNCIVSELPRFRTVNNSVEERGEGVDHRFPNEAVLKRGSSENDRSEFAVLMCAVLKRRF